LAKFHSAFTDRVQRYASKHQIDVRDLIVRLCEEDQVSAPDDLLERLSHELATLKMPRVLSIPAFRIEWGKDKTPIDALNLLLKELRARAVKSGKFSALNVVIAGTPRAEFAVSSNIHSTQSHVVASVELSDEPQLEAVLKAADGRIDVVLLDVDRKPFGPPNSAEIARRILSKTILLTYLDSRVWVEAVEDQVVRLLQEVLDGSEIVIAGDQPRSRFLALRFAERGAHVTLLKDPGRQESGSSSDAPARSPSLEGTTDLQLTQINATSAQAPGAMANARVIIVWPANAPWFDRNLSQSLSPNTYVLDAGIGAILPDAIDEARRRGCLLLRVNIWPALTGALSAAHESLIKTNDAFGWDVLDGIPIVAGGAMGNSGDVIVDTVRHPTRIIGVCDGHGGVRFRYSESEAELVRRVQAEINRRLVAPQLTGTAG